MSAIKCVLENDGYKVNHERLLLSSVIKTCKLENDSTKTRLPIQKKLLDLVLFDIVRSYEEKQPYLEALYITAFLFGYYGLMRIGELAEGPHTVKAKNIHKCDTKKKLMIFLYTSKTHGLCDRPQKIRIEGTTRVVVTNNSKLLTTSETRNSFFCPYKWAKLYISLRRLRLDDEENFFIFKDGTNLKPYHLRNVLRKSIKNLQLDESLYNVHSLRIGRATDLQKYGYDVEHIKQSGRWKSNAVYKYLRNW